MGKLQAFLFVIFVLNTTYLQAETIKADFRHRPPEMIIDGKKKSGPLIDILELAVHKLGHNIQWRDETFPMSIHDLEEGKLDILPRTLKTKRRDLFINYLGPIGYQDKTIYFLVKKGEENLINSYKDLKKLKIGVRRKTAYFKRFNLDSSLDKIETVDDGHMVMMFDRFRFDTMAVLDIDSIEYALKKNNITNYTYANYKFKQKIGNYYAMSKNSKNSFLYLELSQTLKNMAKSGEITKIYKLYGVKPPAQ